MAGLIGAFAKTTGISGRTGTNAGRLYVDVLPNVAKFNPTLSRTLQGANSELSRTMHTMGASLTKTITAPILGFFAAAYTSFTQLQSVQNQVNQVIQNTGGAAGYTTDEINNLSHSISYATGNTQQYIEQGAKMLLTFTDVKSAGSGVNDVFGRALAISEDLSVAMGVDLNRAVTAVGRSLTQPTQAGMQLRRVNTTLTEAARDQIKVLEDQGKHFEAQKVLLDELEKSFKGIAAAGVTPIQRLRASMSDLFNAIGTYVAGPLSTLINGLSSTFEWMSQLPGPVKAVSVAFAGLLAALGPVLYIAGSLHSDYTILGRTMTGFKTIIGGLVLQFKTFFLTLKGRGLIAALSTSFGALGRAMASALNYLKAFVLTWKEFGAIRSIKLIFSDIVSGLSSMVSGLIAAAPYLAVLATIAAIGKGVWDYFHRATIETEAATKAAANWAQKIKEGTATLDQGLAAIDKQKFPEPSNLENIPNMFKDLLGGDVQSFITGLVSPSEYHKQLTAQVEAQAREQAKTLLRQRVMLQTLNTQYRAGTIIANDYWKQALGAGIDPAVIKDNLQRIRAITAATDIAQAKFKEFSQGIRLSNEDMKGLATGTGESTIQIKRSMDEMLKDAQTAVDQNTETLTNQMGVFANTQQGIAQINASNMKIMAQKGREWITSEWQKAQDFMAQTVQSISQSLLSAGGDPFAKLEEGAHYTDAKLKKLFDDWSKRTIQFSQDIGTLAKRFPEFANQLLQSGNTEMAHYLATHRKAAREVGSTYESTLKQVQSAAQKIANAIIGPLKDIKAILLAIAKKWGVNVNLNDNGVEGKLKTYLNYLNQIGKTYVATIITRQIREGNWTGGYTGYAGGGWPNGVALVGEKGPELIKAPYGSYVFNAKETQDLMGRIGGSGRGQQIIRGELIIKDWKHGIAELQGEMDWNYAAGGG